MIKYLKIFVLMSIVSFGILVFNPSINIVHAADSASTESPYQGVLEIFKKVKGGVSIRQPNIINKRVGGSTAELGVRDIIIFVADRAVMFFSFLAIVLMLGAGLMIIVKGSDATAVATQGKNIAAILGSIFFMQLAKTVVAIFFQEKDVPGPSTPANIIGTANSYIVEPIINLGLSFLGIVAIGFLVYNSFIMLVSGSDDSKGGEALSNVGYGLGGLLLVLLSKPIVQVFYDFNYGGKPLEPDFNLGVTIAYQLAGYGIWLLAIIAIALIIGAGYMLVAGFGSEGQIKTAGNIVKYIIVGFVLILSAYSLVAFLGLSTI